MSSTDNGTQSIYFRYTQPLVSSDLSKLLHNIIKPGIYDGGTCTIDSGNNVLIAPMDVICNTSANQAVHVKTTVNATLTIAEATPYITCQFTWVDSTTNYMDFTAKALGSILTNDIIIGKGVYVANVLTSFDYTEKTWGIEQSLLPTSEKTITSEAVTNAFNFIIPNSYSNLLVSRPSVTSVLLSYDALWIQGIMSTSETFTLDITTSGLLGLDTGAEAADAWYYIWIIAKVDGTVSAILSASATAPTMPAGYTLKRLVSMVRNTSGNFVNFVQDGKNWRYNLEQLLIDISVVDSGYNRDGSVFIPEYVSKITMSHSSFGVGTVQESFVFYLGGYINGAYVLQRVGYVETPANVTGASGSSVIVDTVNRYIRTMNTCSTPASLSSISFRPYIHGFEVPL
jgi:hypothetical protein